MKDNQILLSQCGTNEENRTEFIQNEESIMFNINGKTELEIKANGNFYKGGKPIGLDKEIFDGLKNFIEHFTTLVKEHNETKTTFQQELTTLINRYSKENDSNTPDFILAEYLTNCLNAYNQSVTARDKWFSVDVWAEDKILK